MQVYLIKDVENLGVAGEIVTVSDGHATNFLVPRKLAIAITNANRGSFEKRKKVVEKREEVIASKTSMLAERIKSIELVLKKKIHEGEKLYGSVSAAEVVDLLAAKGVSVQKSQIDFAKTIKTLGSHVVTVKLSSKLLPTLTLRVVAE